MESSALANTDPSWVTDGFGTQSTCGPFAEDNSFLVSPLAIAPAGGLVLPYSGNGGGNPTVIPAGTSIGSRCAERNLSGWNFVLTLLRTAIRLSGGGLGTGCPVDGIPAFSNIFAEDTIAASAYNSFQASLEKAFLARPSVAGRLHVQQVPRLGVEL